MFFLCCVLVLFGVFCVMEKFVLLSIFMKFFCVVEMWKMFWLCIYRFFCCICRDSNVFWRCREDEDWNFLWGWFRWLVVFVYVCMLYLVGFGYRMRFLISCLGINVMEECLFIRFIRCICNYCNWILFLDRVFFIIKLFVIVYFFC